MSRTLTKDDFDLDDNSKYRFKGQEEVLVYIGRRRYPSRGTFWYQFSLADDKSFDVWAEVSEEDLSLLEKIEEPIHTCPQCGSSELLVYAEDSFKLNTGEFYCHSVKTQDSIAKVVCNDCVWEGTRSMFSE